MVSDFQFIHSENILFFTDMKIANKLPETFLWQHRRLNLSITEFPELRNYKQAFLQLLLGRIQIHKPFEAKFIKICQLRKKGRNTCKPILVDV
jgi:hypothetical protein